MKSGNHRLMKAALCVRPGPGPARCFAALLASLLLFAACDKPVTYEPPPMKRTADLEHQSMEEAKALDAKGDVDGAHAKLSQITKDSTLRSTQEFQTIENKWANLQLDRADKEPDKAKKIALLDSVAQATGASGDLRAKANQKLEIVNPAPALAMPEQSFDPKAAAERLEKAQQLARTGREREAKDLLMDPVLNHKAAPEEERLLIGYCGAKKDTVCLSALADAGVIDQAAMQSILTPPKPTAGPTPMRR